MIPLRNDWGLAAAQPPVVVLGSQVEKAAVTVPQASTVLEIRSRRLLGASPGNTSLPSPIRARWSWQPVLGVGDEQDAPSPRSRPDHVAAGLAAGLSFGVFPVGHRRVDVHLHLIQSAQARQCDAPLPDPHHWPRMHSPAGALPSGIYTDRRGHSSLLPLSWGAGLIGPGLRARPGPFHAPSLTGRQHRLPNPQTCPLVDCCPI